jgi:multiple sugar transport system permease protein
MKIHRRYHQRNFLMLCMLTPYLALLIIFGIVPLIMAFFEIPQKSMANPQGGWKAFKIVMKDFRFLPAAEHVLGFMAIFVPLMIIFVIAMSLMLDIKHSKWKKYLRLAYIIPASVSGSVAVLLWYVLLEPTLSPVKFVMHWFGIKQASQIWQTQNLVYILAFMAFFALAGQWILIQYGSLQSISEEILEAARVDGCGPLQLALRIKLPLIRKYIIYMGVLVFAGGLQIFVEPQLLNTGVYQGIANAWSFDQLSYNLAFTSGDFGGASALSILLLIPSLIGALIVVFKTDMFEDIGIRRSQKISQGSSE